MQMYWSYSGVAKTLVPSTSLYYPSYVGSSPIQVTVTWPFGYSKTTSGGIPQCTLTWGNGVRDGSENWDDGNTSSGDGCSSSCVVESEYTWSGGSASTKDTWSKTTSSSSSTSTTSSSSPSIYIINSDNRWMAYWVWFWVSLSIVLELILAFASERYPTGLYISIEHIQLVTVLPIAGTYFTKEVKGLFRMMRFSLLGFDFANFQDLFNIHCSYVQDNETLKYLGFESSSTIVNIVGFLFVWSSVLVLEMIVFRLLWWSKLSTKWWTKLTKIIKTVRNWMWLGFYIRYAFLGFLFVSVSSIDEINNYSNEERRWSWITCFVILFWVVVFFLVVLSSYLFTSNKAKEFSILDEFINLVKFTLKAMMFSTLFLLHRLLISIFLTADFGLNNQSICISLIWVHSTYLIWLIAIRPYNTIRANISKIICETSVLVLIALMISYKDSSDWESSTQYVFLYLITFSSWIPFLTTLSKNYLNIFSIFYTRDHPISKKLKNWK